MLQVAAHVIYNFHYFITFSEIDGSCMFGLISTSGIDGVFDGDSDGTVQDTCNKTNIEAGTFFLCKLHGLMGKVSKFDVRG